MAQSFRLREQAERCRRLARDSTDPCLHDSLMRLADEYAARASVQESEDESEDASDDANDNRTVWQARPDDDGVA
jgi:hypothetical protein